VTCAGSPPTRPARAAMALATCLCAAAIAGCASPLALTRGLSRVEGEVRVSGGRESLQKLGPVVVYLEGRGELDAPGAGTLTLSDLRRDGLGHDLVVLTRGQSLRFVSQSGVAHRLFAIRGPERLDVEVTEGGESRVVPMEHTGWTRFYCSLHPDEIWDVFVSPSPHFALLDPEGAYHIDNVPRGDYALSIWSLAVNGAVRRVHVGFRTSALEPIWLDPAKLHP